MRVALVGFDEGPLVSLLAALLQRAGHDVAAAISDADAVLLDVGTPFGVSELDAAPRLAYLGVSGTDHARVDVREASARGIVVTHVPGYATDAVATIAAGFASGRNRPGILGLGRIGLRLAELLRESGASEIAYWSRRRREDAERELGLRFASPEAILRDCDVVSTHLAGSAQLAGLLDGRMLASASDLHLVHLAALSLVDLEALERRLRAPGLLFVTDHADDLSDEQRRRLALHDGFVDLPPTASTSESAVRERVERTLDNLDAFLRGRSRDVVGG